MSEKIYCGIRPIPKGSRLGSMKECADKREIRYYGIKKIDPKLIGTIQGAKKTNSRDLIFKEITKNKGKIKNIKNKIAGTKDKAIKDKLQKDLEKLVEKTNELSKQFNEIEKRGQKRLNNSRRLDIGDQNRSYISKSRNSRSNRSRSRNSRSNNSRSRNSRSGRLGRLRKSTRSHERRSNSKRSRGSRESRESRGSRESRRLRNSIGISENIYKYKEI